MNLMLSIKADKARNLKLTPISAMKLEKEQKKSVTKYIQTISQRVSDNDVTTEEIVQLLWLELRWEDKELTKEDCYDILEKMMEEYGGIYNVAGMLIQVLFYYIGWDDEKVNDTAKKELKKQTKKTQKTAITTD